MFSIEQLVKKDVLILNKEVKIADAIEGMRNSEDKTGVFLEDGRVVGIVTESDIIGAFLKGFSYSDKAYNAATKSVVYLNSNRSLEYVVDMLILKNLKQIPIVDADGKFVGLLTQDAVIEYLDGKNDKLKQKAIDMIVASKVICAHVNDSVKHCALLMNDYRIGFLPILDGDRLVGQITNSAILSIIDRPDVLEMPVSFF